MIPTEPIGSIPRPPELVAAIRAGAAAGELAPLLDAAVRATVAEFEATGSPVIGDGEQGKLQNFWSYPVQGAANTAPDGFRIPVSNNAGGLHHRMPRLTHGPFRYGCYADQYLRAARRHATRPVKQAIISPSALSLLYPHDGIAGYPREQFLEDLVREHETEIRRCLEAGAHKVQVDFAEGPLAMRLDPSGALLASFVHLNNMALDRFSSAERALIGLHVSPAGIRTANVLGAADAGIDYAELLPALFEIRAGSFYIAVAGQPDPERVLRIARDYARPDQCVFAGVTDPANPAVETAEEVRDRVLLAARYLAPHRLGTTDDTGFAPFFDDDSLSRATAFAKVRARVEGTRLAAAILEGSA
ncbi:5-methyltetrahydropteroyltriglutamate--homocysteine methyltransferase [Massilia yuzhufengensis]|uniref:5-methyltetrahydropteroyltriglutamate--homocysteine methyltransferase n=1 Tax=Massilia yuzhufengensis TaxID=1164594 RepID=A0A1I1PQ74_9BURK|nr:5-methyltetrahydropteroyltriglutamate--homocysteine methyltransferase [Massilia yuzhufengensis]SFD09788.1 5-methyltetrahydropteroyltriglutamate--homocysteine methyltransferase [Massilia yuzhufengensis]